MKKIHIGNGEIVASEISLGCMRINSLSRSEASELINTALEEGINFFDHADIYGGGKSEEVFADAVGMNPGIREKFIIQNKCGSKTNCVHNLFMPPGGLCEGAGLSFF